MSDQASESATKGEGHGLSASQEASVQALRRLLHMHNRLMAAFNAHLHERYDINPNEFQALMTLGRMGSAAAHEVASITGLNTITVSRAVAALESAGRVDVKQNEENRRSNILTLTPQGQKMFDEMLPASVQVADYLLAEMSEVELKAFSAQLAAMITRLQAVDDEGRSAFLEATRPQNQ